MENKDFSVLIVDDNIEILKLLKKVLETKKWRVFTVPTGESALAVLAKEKIDLILLDIRLPGKSGLDILKEIKEKYPNTAVIMITGFGYNDELVNESVRLGAAGYVSKGMPMNELLEAINNVLTKK